jgi:hypothetical protein
VKQIFFIALIGLTLILAIWGGSCALLLRLYPDPADHGTFGDMFGAVNALFSGWAFLGVIIAIILQRQELELQRDELRESRMAQQASVAAQREQLDVALFQAQIEALNHIISGLDRRIRRSEDVASLSETTEHNRLVMERDQFEERLRDLIQSKFDKIA